MSSQNWKSKTIEVLENDFWGEPNFNSYLGTTCHELRKKTIGEFEVEDLRIMIGQNIGLKFLLPLAIEKLKEDLFVSGNFYEGDLLQVVLNVKDTFWIDNSEIREELKKLILGRDDDLKSNNIKYDNFLNTI